ncbi:MAG: restriction endonuclease subunit S [Desulfovibrio sp.]|nr:restriction endonuclease subunit S [Desulfovibrio sp.]
MRKMKDSGVAWIGAIPEEWEVLRLKYIFSERDERCEADTELPLLSVSEYYGVANRKDKIKEDETLIRAETLEGYKICHPHDIVSNIMLAWKSALGESQSTGIVSPSYCVYQQISDTCTRYFHYLLRTDIYANVFKQYSTGIIDSRLRLYSDKFLSLFVQVPSVDEQRRIADYLDTKCAEIDHSMELVRQGIDKLKEYKKSVITEAVTKGLDPDVPMKDSGVPWIGEMPETWKIIRLKYVCTLNPRINVDDINPETELSFFPMESIKNGYVVNTQKKFFSEYCSSYNIFNNGDILLAKVTPCFENGNIAIASNLEKCIGFGTSEIFIIRANNIDNKFLFYWLRNELFKLRAISTMSGTGGLKRISSQFMRDENILVPPRSEQHRISAYLDAKCAEIDTLIAQKQALLDKLAEYKKSLIFECVTGKRKVVA